MPEIIIQSDGSFLIPRGSSEDNAFFLSFLEDLVDPEALDALSGFFSIAEDSEIIVGEPGLCG